MTVLPGMENVHAHPLESGGSAFYAVTVLASGVGSVSERSVPYRNEEGIAEYLCDPDEDSEFIGYLSAGQSLQEFLAEHSGVEYLGFAQEVVYEDAPDEGEGSGGYDGSGDAVDEGASTGGDPDASTSGDDTDGNGPSAGDDSTAGGSGEPVGDEPGSDADGSGSDDENIPEEDDGPEYGTVRSARVEVTPELAAGGKLANYSAEPIFDENGNFIQVPGEDTPIYDWSVPEDKRFARQYELEESNALPQPTGGYAGQTYRYDEDATPCTETTTATPWRCARTWTWSPSSTPTTGRTARSATMTSWSHTGRTS